MNDWRSINELKVGDAGRSIDVLDHGSYYKGIQLAGIDLKHVIVEELSMAEGKIRVLGGYDRFTLTHTYGEIELGYGAQWRYHESS